MQHRLDAVAVVLKPLIGLVFGLTSSGCPHPDQIFAGFAVPVEITPVMLERQDHPFFEGQRFRHLAVLHFLGGVIVGDPFLRIIIQHHADLMASICQDDAGLAVGDDAAADFGGHLVMLPNVFAVVAHEFLQSGAALRDRWWQFGYK